MRHQLEGLGVFALGPRPDAAARWRRSTLAAAAPPAALEVAVLVVANAAATLARFVLLRGWVFRPGRAATPPVPSDERSPA